ncbi:MAG: hypothetical protein AB1758_03035 [Candidatus Eremiobacterota bacterium]
MKNARNFHVPIPAPLREELREAAARLGKPATVLAREAIERYLRQLRREAVDAAITEWALEMAGTEYDLDPQLEQAGIEFLLEDE